MGGEIRKEATQNTHTHTHTAAHHLSNISREQLEVGVLLLRQFVAVGIALGFINGFLRKSYHIRHPIGAFLLLAVEHKNGGESS